MLRIRASLWIGLGMLFFVPAFADTIHLKNGRVIQADSSHVEGTKLVYEIGDDRYAIPSALVTSIDTGVGAVAPKISGAEIPAPEDPDLAAGLGHVTDVIHDNQIDTAALSRAEEGSPQTAAIANFLAGKFEAAHGHFESGVKYLERALHYDAENAGFMIWEVNLLLRMRRAQDSLTLAERATRLAPSSSEAWAQLGYVYFFLDRTQDAVNAWKRSTKIRPDQNLEGMIARGQREMSAEGSFSQDETGHFTVHYEGGQSSASLRRAILETLEANYDDLVRDFGITPKNISVSLYSEQTYFDVTQAPSWSAALNDGKLRIPISGLTAVDSSLARVLKHELTHSFINQMTHGRCPQWLNEGVAQLEEGKTTSRVGTGLARMYASQQQVPLAALEAPFTRLSDRQASVAYAEGLAASQYIRDTYGMSDIVRMLQRLGEGQSTEGALRSTLHSDYEDFEASVADWLKRNYGV